MSGVKQRNEIKTHARELESLEGRMVWVHSVSDCEIALNKSSKGAMIFIPQLSQWLV